MDTGEGLPIIDNYPTKVMREIISTYTQKNEPMPFLRGNVQIRDCGNSFEIVNEKDTPLGALVFFPGTVYFKVPGKSDTYYDFLNTSLMQTQNERRSNKTLEELATLPVDMEWIASYVVSRFEGQLKKDSKVSHDETRKNQPYIKKPLSWEDFGLDKGFIRSLREVKSFSSLLHTLLPGRSDLSWCDIGTGSGTFPLELARQRKELGIHTIAATDQALKHIRPETYERLQAEDVDVFNSM